MFWRLLTWFTQDAACRDHIWPASRYSQQRTVTDCLCRALIVSRGFVASIHIWKFTSSYYVAVSGNIYLENNFLKGVSRILIFFQRDYSILLPQKVEQQAVMSFKLIQSSLWLITGQQMLHICRGWKIHNVRKCKQIWTIHTHIYLLYYLLLLV